MQNTNLIPKRMLLPENIDRHQLTLSLLNEGSRAGIFTQVQVESVQTRLLVLLSQAILEYTHHESSSVKSETAHNIFQSILYCCDACLLNLSPEKAVDLLLNLDISQIYARGLEVIKDKVEQAKAIYAEVETTKLNTTLIAYNDTIEYSFPAFWQDYDVYFDAHSTPAAIDYPLLRDDMSWSGIIYIKNYLENLLLENKFCQYFPQQEIAELLKALGRKYGLDYREMLINIPELLLKNALCSLFLKKRMSLTLSPTDVLFLEKQLQGVTEQECRPNLEAALESLYKELTITCPVVKDYFRPLLDTFCTELINAVRLSSFTRLLVIQDNSSVAPIIQYTAGSRLSDEQLRLVIEELQYCEDGKAKAAVIQSEINNLEDLVQVFGAYCIFGDEYIAIFSQMTEYDLAVLTVDFWDESALCDDKIVLKTNSWHRTENELYWQEKLLSYLENGNPSFYQKVIRLSQELKSSNLNTLNS